MSKKFNNLSSLLLSLAFVGGIHIGKSLSDSNPFNLKYVKKQHVEEIINLPCNLFLTNNSEWYKNSGFYGCRSLNLKK